VLHLGRVMAIKALPCLKAVAIFCHDLVDVNSLHIVIRFIASVSYHLHFDSARIAMRFMQKIN